MLSFEYVNPLLPKPQTMYYEINRERARVVLLGGKDSRGKTRWPSAQAWANIAKQYRPIAAALAIELKTVVKVKEGPEADAETLAKFGADGKEIPLWPHGIQNDGPTITFD